MNAVMNTGRSAVVAGRILRWERAVYVVSTCQCQPGQAFRELCMRCALKRHQCHTPGAGCGTARAGFSLVEVMIAILILAVAVVGLTQGFTTALASSKDSEQQTTAALFAAGQIETLRAGTGLVDETTEGDCGDELPLYRWRQTISPADVDGLHEVTVAVEHAKTGALIYELKTLLFEVPATAPEKSPKPKSKGGAGE